MSILDIANQIAETGPDLNEAKSGGGGARTVAAEGTAQARLIGYVEVGRRKRKTEHGEKDDPACYLEFELHGPKYPPIEVGEGESKRTIYQTIRQRIDNVSQNEKATYFKLFAKMNWDQKAKHFSQLLGKAFRVQISHWVPDAAKPDEKVAQIAKDGILVPYYDDPETGEKKVINPPAPKNPLRLFVWASAPEHIGPLWESIFIDGSYTVGEGDKQKTVSRNFWQDTIRKATNFEGSAIQAFLAAKGESFLPPAQDKPAGLEQATATEGGAKPDADDPLAGV